MVPGASPQPAAPGTAPYWTARRQRIRVWMARLSQSLAQMYEGAVHQLEGPKTPGYTRLVCHAAREILTKLPLVVGGESEIERVHYSARVDEIAVIWDRAGLSMAGVVPVTVAGAIPPMKPGFSPLPTQVVELIGELVEAHKANARLSDVVAGMLKSLSRAPTLVPELLGPTVKRWMDVHKWFVKHAHDDGKRTDEKFDLNALQMNFGALEDLLDGLSKPAAETLGEIDEELERANR